MTVFETDGITVVEMSHSGSLPGFVRLSLRNLCSGSVASFHFLPPVPFTSLWTENEPERINKLKNYTRSFLFIYLYSKEYLGDITQKHTRRGLTVAEDKSLLVWLLISRLYSDQILLSCWPPHGSVFFVCFFCQRIRYV